MKKLTEQNENNTVPALDIFDNIFNILYPDHRSEDFITCELYGNSVEVITHDDKGRCHKMTITYEVCNEYDLGTVMAEQQLTGYVAGRSGDITTLVEQMNLSEREWILIKEKYPTIVYPMDIAIIDSYFELKEEEMKTSEEIYTKWFGGDSYTTRRFPSKGNIISVIDEGISQFQHQLLEFCYDEITERRDYSASKTFEVVIEKIKELSEERK